MRGAKLLARVSDQVALADKDLISIPAEALPLAAVAPAHHGALAGQRANGVVLEPQDLLDDRTLRQPRHEANLTRRMAVSNVGGGRERGRASDATARKCSVSRRPRAVHRRDVAL